MTDNSQYEKLRAGYRAQRIDEFVASASGAATSSTPPPTTRLAEGLRDFCLATGRDLEELNGFLQQVDAELADMVPK
jgi:hypothetical protein